MANTSRDLGADAVPVEYLAAGRVAAAPQVAELYILRLASPPPGTEGRPHVAGQTEATVVTVGYKCKGSTVCIARGLTCFQA